MHIADGILSWPVIGAGYGLSAAWASWGLSKLENEDLPKTACVASAFFVASLVHVPIGPSSAHLMLNGLAGAMLGPAAFPAILVALALQALLFQFGGFLSLGVNTFNMGLPAILCGMLFRPALARGTSQALAACCGFGAGFLGIALSCLLASLSLLLSGGDYKGAAAMIFAAHVPAMFVEGFVTAFAVAFLQRLRPEVFSISNSNASTAADAEPGA